MVNKTVDRWTIMFREDFYCKKRLSNVIIAWNNNHPVWNKVPQTVDPITGQPWWPLGISKYYKSYYVCKMHQIHQRIRSGSLSETGSCLLWFILWPIQVKTHLILGFLFPLHLFLATLGFFSSESTFYHL